MPQVDKPLHDLKEYRGINPRPADFDAYWERGLQELDRVQPNVELIPVDVLGNCNAELFDMYFTGVGGARVFAKLLRPRNGGRPGPAIVQFHGYSGNSGDWVDKMAYVNEGYTVAALDCRGQAGLSEDNSQVTGNTLNGHFIRGLRDAPEKLLFRQIFLDTVQLTRLVMEEPGVDPARVGVMGGSQGGALAIACAALEPRVRRVAAYYPFLSDYQRVWQMDLAKDAYLELKRFFRENDPLHLHEEEIFTRLGYIDVQHLAPRIQGQVLMGLTLMDTICPPSTQFAVYNKITAPKEAVIFHDHAHEILPRFLDRVFKFMMGLKD